MGMSKFESDLTAISNSIDRRDAELKLMRVNQDALVDALTAQLRRVERMMKEIGYQQSTIINTTGEDWALINRIELEGEINEV